MQRPSKEVFINSEIITFLEKSLENTYLQLQ